LEKVMVFREPLAQGCDAIEPAQGIEDGSLKKHGALTCSVVNEVIDVYSQHFPRERIGIRSRTQSAPPAILNKATRGIPDNNGASKRS
jgi:hypothetical protein